MLYGPDARVRAAKGARHMNAKTRAPRWRRILVSLLVILGCILAPLSMLGIWLKAELLDTGTYVSTMAPLADNPDIQNALADRISNTLVVNTSLEQQVEGALPPRHSSWRRRSPTRSSRSS